MFKGMIIEGLVFSGVFVCVRIHSLIDLQIDFLQLVEVCQ